MNFFRRVWCFITARPIVTPLWLSVPLVMVDATVAQTVTTVRVDINEGSDDPATNGADWGEDAFKYLQDALTYADDLEPDENNHVHIWVANGNYRADQNADNPTGQTNGHLLSFQLRNYVKLYGGFKGGTDGVGGETALNQRRIRAQTARLDGDLLGNDSAMSEAPGPYSIGRTDNSQHVVKATNVNVHARLDGFFIQNGEAPTSSFGGGAWLQCCNGIIANCTFFANSGTYGAAVCVNDLVGCESEPRIVNCTFVGNFAEDGQGGGLVNFDTELQLVNCVFSGNHSNYGGAIYNYDNFDAATIEIANCTFSRNQAFVNGGGGAIYNIGAIDIDNSILWGNEDGGTPAANQIELGTGGSISVEYSDVEGGEFSGTGSNNINSDPKFFDDDGPLPFNDLRLWCTSPCLNVGSNSLTIDDFANVDDDTDIGDDEPTPDRDWKDRILNTTVDMGAYERIECNADITQNGVVDVDDLIAVVNAWGNCPGAPAFCFADVKSASGEGQCNGNGVVDVDDLLVVINNWGACDGGPPPIYASMPQSLDDCWDECEEKHVGDLEGFLSCYEGCATALCEAGIIDCDE